MGEGNRMCALTEYYVIVRVVIAGLKSNVCSLEVMRVLCNCYRRWKSNVVA